MSEPSTIPAGCDPVAAQRWTQTLARWTQSGLSVAAFCATHHITKSNFFRWKRILAGPNTHTQQHARQGQSKTTKAAVVPIRVTPTPAHATPIELILPSGTVVRLPADARPEFLVAILRGLEAQPC